MFTEEHREILLLDPMDEPFEQKVFNRSFYGDIGEWHKNF